MKYGWRNTETKTGQSYTCAYCNNNVAPSIGYVSNKTTGVEPGHIFICPNCTQPTFINKNGEPTPSPSYGNDVSNISNNDIERLYSEARSCFSVNAYTAAALCCRKLLMNLSVSYGADEGKSFVHYINYLEENHYTPPNSNGWVDQIRQKGNEATHEIPSISEEDAKKIIHFSEMLLKFNFEFQST